MEPDYNLTVYMEGKDKINGVDFSNLVSFAAIFGMSRNAPKNGCEDFQRKSV